MTETYPASFPLDKDILSRMIKGSTKTYNVIIHVIYIYIYNDNVMIYIYIYIYI